MTNFFVQNIHDEIEIVAEKEWRKCLKESPVFIIREIEKIRIKSAKSSSAIMKTTNCGKRFKEEGYLSADDVFVANNFCAGETGYFNHIMALSFEIADYSLHQLIPMPKKQHALAWLDGGVYHQQIHLQNNHSWTQL